MVKLFNFIFDNALLFIIVGFGYFIYHQYKELKTKTASIKEIFTKTLDKYLADRIKEAREITDRILKEYGKEDEVSLEITRLLTMIDKGVTGTINQKVETSNAINKFKLSKKIDLEKYPFLKELETIGTFTEEDMSSVDNGVAIARREYNAQAFRYNEKASSFPIQYLTKVLGLVPQYTIFAAPKSSAYDDIYEVFEEEEPEINTLTSLNREEQIELPKEETITVFQEPVEIEHNDTVLKPTNLGNDDKKED